MKIQYEIIRKGNKKSFIISVSKNLLFDSLIRKIHKKHPGWSVDNLREAKAQTKVREKIKFHTNIARVAADNNEIL